jgi:hypothetical protein
LGGRKRVCEAAPPIPSTHASVQTSTVSSPRTAPLTNLPCTTQTGNNISEARAWGQRVMHHEITQKSPVATKVSSLPPVRSTRVTFTELPAPVALISHYHAHYLASQLYFAPRPLQSLPHRHPARCNRMQRSGVAGLSPPPPPRALVPWTTTTQRRCMAPLSAFFSSQLALQEPRVLSDLQVSLGCAQG